MPLTAYYTQLLQAHTLLPCSYISSKIMMLRFLQVDVEATHMACYTFYYKNIFTRNLTFPKQRLFLK